MRWANSLRFYNSSLNFFFFKKVSFVTSECVFFPDQCPPEQNTTCSEIVSQSARLKLHKSYAHRKKEK